MSKNSSKSVAEIRINSKTPKKQVFDMSTAFLKKFIFGNKNRLGGGGLKKSKKLFAPLGWGGQVHTDLVKNDASIICNSIFLNLGITAVKF